MAGFTKALILGLLIIMALVLFPTVHWGVSNVDKTGFLPLLAMITAGLPYIFLVIVGYIVLKNK
jgi:hypothetical protein